MRRPDRLLYRAGLALVATALLAAVPVVTPRPPLASASLSPAVAAGYWMVGGDGSVYPFGAAGDLGSLRGSHLTRPVVGMAPTPSGAGYWMVASDGGIFSFGDAGFYGSTGALKLNRPIVGMAATPTGKGYWFVASDGGIFSFGDAGFYGSTGALKLNRPIVGMAATPTGKGYWFVASDGGIFSFGDAGFYGSTGALKLNRPIVGMAATPTGKGYWFVASDGGIFNFGDASFLGSVGGQSPPAEIAVMAGFRPPAPTQNDPRPTTATTDPTAITSVPTTGPAPSGAAFDIGLVGDTGYSADQYPIFDRVVDQMNTLPLAFVVHAGDFKDATSACTDSRFAEAKESFNRAKAPFVYAPGDNEWMDCDDTFNRAPMDSIERLNKLREMFFAQDTSLGVNHMPLTTQRQAGYPENARWTKEGVVFATLNAPGPSDDLDYAGPNPPEAGARRVANLAWLRQTFQFAKATNAPGVMIIWQVDPWQPKFRRTWDYLLNDSTQDGPELKQLTVELGKPVVLVHGDTHMYRIDKGGWPTPKNGGTTIEMVGAWNDVPNFTRVETYAGGQPTAASTGPPEPKNWIRVTVAPASPQVFTFTTETAG